MNSLTQYKSEFLDFLKSYDINETPEQLYKPIDYILNLGGKRMRPILVMMSAEIFSGQHKQAMYAALAVEMFHNFSLVHDDIMDDAPLRRGQKTVHEKWDLNTGILSGDAMLILAYQLFEHYPDEQFKPLAKLFSKTAIEVCEGQQYDIDFEQRDDVSIEEYLKMIEFKTAVLVGAALQMGAIVANQNKHTQDLIYDFGKNLGIAFQIQDDYLDAFGDPEKFGKQVGGDIIENKKTYLYLKALENDSSGQLEHLFSISPKNPNSKIETVKSLYNSTGATEFVKKEIKNYTQKAYKSLDDIGIPQQQKEILIEFGDFLMNRSV